MVKKRRVHTYHTQHFQRICVFTAGIESKEVVVLTTDTTHCMSDKNLQDRQNKMIRKESNNTIVRFNSCYYIL